MERVSGLVADADAGNPPLVDGRNNRPLGGLGAVLSTGDDAFARSH